MTAGTRHWESTLDSFLVEDAIREAARAEAVTRVVAWQLAQEMETIETSQRAAALLGRALRPELV